MKYSDFWLKIRQSLFISICCFTPLLFTQCSETNKGTLVAKPALKGNQPASNSEKKVPKKTKTSNDSSPPIGFWTDEESGLYVSIRPRTEKVQDEDYEVTAGDLIIAVGGPPNKRMQADDVFFSSKYFLKKNKLTMTGFFNWDRNKTEVVLQVSWTRSSVELQIVKNEKFTRYEAKHYALKLRE